jgi:hypothetical protein
MLCEADTNSHLLGHNSVLHGKFTDVPRGACSLDHLEHEDGSSKLL